MFLHVGGSQIVFSNELIGIFNYDPGQSEINREFLHNPSAKHVNALTGTSDPKSFILSDHTIYISPVSPLTLSRRKTA